MTGGAKRSLAYDFIGIGGSGMMPLALLYAGGGYSVTGCDRAFDRDPADERIGALRDAGIELHPESGPVPRGSRLIVSTAIEEGHPALDGGSPPLHRSEALLKYLAEKVPGSPRILVAGSSGKSTTTAMIGWILARAGLDPLLYIGGRVSELAPWGARVGTGPIVAEVDESDRTIERFSGTIGVLTSVSADHMGLNEVRELFRRFLTRCETAVLSGAAFKQLGIRGGGFVRVASVLEEAASGLRGDFNRSNEALAISAVEMFLGGSRDVIRSKLRSFPGVHRRLERVFRNDRWEILDDFAHNPEKMAAALRAVQGGDGATVVVFQPHGYGPTHRHSAAWARTFSKFLNEKRGDRVILLPIFDAGGTADRTISSEAILQDMPGGLGFCVRDRIEATESIREFVASRAGGIVLVMGARDPSLGCWARSLPGKIFRKEED
ncbi:MAG: hypothetical protein D6679_12425 [Candidatus Hydrogenedentota bacterium]|nr:MAG: hypothetical protein D6679_12425 [Candidatus Hydrogenedentota bacterium]